MNIRSITLFLRGGKSAAAILILVTALYSCCTQRKMSKSNPVIFTSRDLYPAPPDKDILKVNLLGDPGCKAATATIHSLLADISVQNSESAEDVTLVLGDNIYPAGATMWSKGKFNKQMAAWGGSASESQIIYMPGNHDYGLVGKKRNKVIKFEKWLNENGQENISYQPATANYKTQYNPLFTQILYEEAGIGKVVLVILDSEWLISGESNKLSGSDYTIIRDKMYAQLQTYINDNLAKEDILLLSMHHPLHSMGHHGMEDKLKQDLHNGRYAEMADELEQILLKADIKIVIASGHEHMMQIIKTANPNIIQIVSGAGSKASDQEDLENHAENYSNIYKDTKIWFASDAIGYIDLVFYIENNSIRVIATIINAQASDGRPRNIGSFTLF